MQKISRRRKGKLPNAFKFFVNEAENVGHVIKEFLSDDWIELQNYDTRKVLEGEGKISRVSMTFTPKQNSVVKRENHILVENAQTMHTKNVTCEQ